MGRIVVTEYISVDGVVEAPSGDESFERVGWTDAFSRGVEGEQFKFDETMSSDALLLGRLTYDGFAPVWPHYEGELADKFNTMPKYVVSQNLTKPQWNTPPSFPVTWSMRSGTSNSDTMATSLFMAARNWSRR